MTGSEGDAPDVPVTSPGQTPDVWRDRVAGADRLTTADLGALVPGRDRLVAFAAHPDDESIGAGRLLSAWRHAGGRAQAVLATAGEACFDHVADRPPGLAERRLGEWRDALAALDVEPTATYGLADGGLDAAEDALTEAVRGSLAALGPADDLVALAPHPLDPHPDHRAVGRAVGRVAAGLGIPVWSYRMWLTYWSPPEVDLGGRLVTVEVPRADDERWTRAVRCFASQVEPYRPGWGPVIPPEMLAHHDRQLLVLPGADR